MCLRGRAVCSVGAGRALYRFRHLGWVARVVTDRIPDIEPLLAQMLLDRQALGVRKYGTTVAGNPLTHRQWLQHALEEALDLAVYLRRAIAEIDATSDDFK